MIGIDRINSKDKVTNKKLPYSIDNCVSSLPVCNYLKSDLDFDKIDIIYKNASKKL